MEQSTRRTMSIVTKLIYPRKKELYHHHRRLKCNIHNECFAHLFSCSCNAQATAAPRLSRGDVGGHSTANDAPHTCASITIGEQTGQSVDFFNDFISLIQVSWTDMYLYLFDILYIKLSLMSLPIEYFFRAILCALCSYVKSLCSITTVPLRLAFWENLQVFTEVFFFIDTLSDIIFGVDCWLQFQFTVISDGVELDTKEEIGKEGTGEKDRRLCCDREMVE